VAAESHAKSTPEKQRSPSKTCDVAVVYHCFSHYREPVIRELCQQECPSYELVSGRTSDAPGVKQIDHAKAELPEDQGGYPWRFVHNLWLGGPLLWQTGLIRLALSRKYRAIIYLGNSYFLSTWISAVLARLSGKRVLMWTHGLTRRESGIKSRLRRRFYKLAHALLLYGNWARKLLIEKGFDPERCYVVFNSLDYDAQKQVRSRITEQQCRQLRRDLFAEPDLPIAVFIGRLTHDKQLDLLLRACDLLSQRSQPINLLLIGDGSARADLEKMADEAGIRGRVAFYGACYEEATLGPLLQMSDVGVCPGPVGLTVMHSLAYGTPMIIHDDPEHQGPEFEAVVPGKTGLTFSRGSAESLADAIAEWLDRTASRSPEHIRRDCHEMIERYYNPHMQTEVINTAVLGDLPATQLPLGNSVYAQANPPSKSGG
jgi:glycosyltransferase involved in cell wall biosynthesis